MFIFFSSKEVTLLILHFLKPLSSKNLESPLHVSILSLDLLFLSSYTGQEILLSIPEETKDFKTSLIWETRFRKLLSEGSEKVQNLPYEFNYFVSSIQNIWFSEKCKLTERPVGDGQLRCYNPPFSSLTVHKEQQKRSRQATSSEQSISECINQ